jgi:WD40 repeat protein
MSIIATLRAREIQQFPRKRPSLKDKLEDSFVSGRLAQIDYPLPTTVSSTIAIAISCNGRTVATTHGDHTVKVFIFSSGQQIRSFRGHPRTPWTVKYHPSNPNIVASGCLGFEVSFMIIILNLY